MRKILKYIYAAVLLQNSEMVKLFGPVKVNLKIQFWVILNGNYQNKRVFV